MPLKSDKRLTQAERTEISDNRMLEAAVSLIVDYGPSATSLKEIGLRAGYSRGLAGQRFVREWRQLWIKSDTPPQRNERATLQDLQQ